MQTLDAASKIPQQRGKAVVPAKSINTNIHSSFLDEFKGELDADHPVLKEPLSPANYQQKFHHLLCWEELEHDKQLVQRYTRIEMANNL